MTHPNTESQFSKKASNIELLRNSQLKIASCNSRLLQNLRKKRNNLR